MIFGHLTGKCHVFRYQSPKFKYHRPREILPGKEEIEVIVSGRGYFKDEKGAAPDSGPGSMIWYQAGEVVDVTSHETDPYCVVVFVFDVTGPQEFKRPVVSAWADPSACARFSNDALETFTLSKPPPYFAHCVYARMFWESAGWELGKARRRMPPALERALKFIEASFTGKINIDDTAAAAGVSAPHLHLLFRKHLGAPPMKYVMSLRLRRAAELLASPDMSVKECCFAAGFSDLQNFCSYFKRANGVTPGGYRRRLG
jgi:AraC-like DNA-binding protein